MRVETDDHIACAEGDGLVPARRLNDAGICSDLDIQKFGAVLPSERIHKGRGSVAGAAVDQYDFRLFVGIGLREKIIQQTGKIFCFV